MIKLGAIVPHPPILIPNIGKENVSQLGNTIKAYRTLIAELEKNKIETIVIFSSHGPTKKDIFSINLDEEFEINFEEFGDFASKLKLTGDLGLIQNIREKFFKDTNVQMINQKILDHGSGVPLFLLCYELKNIKIAPIYTSGKNLKNHYNFGEKIAEKLEKDSRKIAVIASGDLAHCLNKKAPGGYSPKGAKFDQKLIENLKNKDTEDILNTNKDVLKDIKACGPKSISMLLGTLSKSKYETKILSYEYPFGVGSLTALFEIF